MFTQLHELIKDYTIAANVAESTKDSKDINAALSFLERINQIRLGLGVAASMREIFYEQKDIPALAGATAIQNTFFSKNDINYVVTGGISGLLNNVNIFLENQGLGNINITRETTPWQHLFPGLQIATPLGQQTNFKLPETLVFGENQSLGISIQGQTEAGFLFLWGAVLRDQLEKAGVDSLRAEFIDEKGKTKYLPSTQVVPLEFQFPDANPGTIATDAQGQQDIFTVKNAHSVLLTHVSTTAPDARIQMLTDEANNQVICENIEMRGVAATFSNPFCTYYPLPYPHLLRRGDRLKARIINGSLITGDEQAADALNYLTFKGVTL